MGKVFTAMSVSLDGYIAGPGDGGFAHLFRWYSNGTVLVPAGDRDFHMSSASAAVWNQLVNATGACVVGRRLFDLTNGWNGNPPVNKPHVVLTHRPPPKDWHSVVPFTFVEGVEQAVQAAHDLAGDKAVSVPGGTVARQCLNAGLLDEVWFNLVPVLFGSGVRYFDELEHAPIELIGPDPVIQGDHVTHLRYLIERRAREAPKISS